ncbi:MAG: hypothetical protein ACYSUI_07685 [Planctomycetota bacterium]|jgi:hypothetical protein
MPKDRCLTEFFAGRTAGGLNRNLSSVGFGLIHHITHQKSFGTIESLLRFCGDPRNLSGFLPDPRGRAIFSRRLVDGIREFRRAGPETGVLPEQQPRGRVAG